MTAVPLHALRADNPLAFLAALGVLSLIDEVRANARLGWTKAGSVWQPLLSADGVREEDDVLDALEEAHGRRDLDLELGWSKDVVLKERAAARDALDDALSADGAAGAEAAARLRAACVAELPLRNDRPPYTPFRLIPHVGRARFLDTALRESRTVTRKALRGALFEPWRYESGVNVLRLDPSARVQERAIMAKAPTHVGPQGVKGTLALAMRGLTFYPLHPQRGEVVCPGWVRRGREQEFRWPVWEPAVSIGVARILVSAPWLRGLEDEKNRRAARAHGVVAAYRSRREASGKGFMLTWGEPLLGEPKQD